MRELAHEQTVATVVNQDYWRNQLGEMNRKFQKK
jgi:hypothetical protein